MDQRSRADSGRTSGSAASLQSSGVGSLSEGLIGNFPEGNKKKIHQEPSLEEEDIDDIVKAFKKSGSTGSNMSEKGNKSGEDVMALLKLYINLTGRFSSVFFSLWKLKIFPKSMFDETKVYNL